MLAAHAPSCPDSRTVISSTSSLGSQDQSDESEPVHDLRDNVYKSEEEEAGGDTGYRSLCGPEGLHDRL